MNASDSILVEKLRNNRDMMSFQELVLKHQKRIYYLARATSCSHEEAEDIVQETFYRSLKKIDQLREPAKYGAWITNIAHNLIINLKRKESNNGKYTTEQMEIAKAAVESGVSSGSNGSDRSLLRKEIRQELRHALVRLPIHHREAFMLFHYHKMSARQISEHLDCTESTARTYVFRAIKKLRVYLEDYYQSVRE